jgi:Cu+-exporting ATPase
MAFLLLLPEIHENPIKLVDMKLKMSFLSLALAGLFFTGCKDAKSPESGNEAASAETAGAPAKMETASFDIDGMTCAMGCAKTIENKLTKMDGVQKATVDFDKKSATVEFDANKQTPEKITAAVEAAADGKTYKVSNVKTTGDHAMVFNKDKKKKKKKSKTGDAATPTTATKGCSEGSGKPACCQGKKSCHEAKTM